MRRHILTALPSWVVASTGVVIAIGQGPDLWPYGITLALGASIVVSFVVQLSLQRKEGLVNRLAFTTAGSLAVGAVGIVIAWALNGIG